MKRYFLLVVFGCISIVTIAQMRKPQFRPDWYIKKPIPENATYLYVVEQGEGATKQEALNKAFCQVLESTALRLGQTVNTAEIHKAVDKGEEYSVVSRAMKIPVNKVCQFERQDSITHRWTVHILCQVAEKGYVTPKFEPFTACMKHTIFDQLMADYEKSIKDAQRREDGLSMLESFFVPGLGQMLKGSRYKRSDWMWEGGGTLVGELLLWGVGAGTYLGAKKQDEIRNQWGIDYNTYQSATNKRKSLLGTSYAFFGLAVGLHAFNLFRAYTLRPRNTTVALQPIVIPTNNNDIAVGLSTTINF